MTIHAVIHGGEIPLPRGWVEVDPFDYEYTGDDPDGEIKAYLDGIADGTVTFKWPVEHEGEDKEYPPDLKIMAIKKHLQHFDEVWYIDLPTGFDPETITYG